MATVATGAKVQLVCNEGGVTRDGTRIERERKIDAR